MTARQTRRRRALPRLWLFTDERAGAGLWQALGRLPRGSGIVFRHYATARHDRRTLYERVRTIARARRLLLVLAGPPAQAIAWRADGVHGARAGRGAARALVRTMAAHNPRDLVHAARQRVDLAFLSPVFPTRSHPGSRTLGTVRFGLAVRSAHVRIAALGGVDGRRFRALRRVAYGWAAIDAWDIDAGDKDQKRKVVPR